MTEELLATHQILSLFETSKGLADQIFDDLYGVFINLDKDGVILRANKAVATYLNVGHEDMLNVHVSRLFTAETWEIFDQHLKSVVNGEKDSTEFELPIDIGMVKPRSFLWQISILSKRIDQTKKIFTCIGRDVSEVKDAQAALVTLEKDLELTKAMQDLLLPQQQDLKIGNVALAASYRAAAVAGGDYWWVNVIDNKVWIIVADVTGHGAGPAMVTSMVAGCVETLKDARVGGQNGFDIPFILGSVNQRLGDLRDRPYWMTACAVEIDLSTGSLKWWSAGAPPIFFIRKDGAVELISKISSPLGMGELNLSSGYTSFGSSDRLILLTDGVLELKNAQDREFSDRGVARFMKSAMDKSVTEFRDELVAHLDNFRNDVPAEDDITFVVVDRLKD